MSNRVHYFRHDAPRWRAVPRRYHEPPGKAPYGASAESLGVDVIEAGFPASSVGDFEAVHAIANVTDVQVAAATRTTSTAHGRR